MCVPAIITRQSLSGHQNAGMTVLRERRAEEPVPEAEHKLIRLTIPSVDGIWDMLCSMDLLVPLQTQEIKGTVRNGAMNVKVWKIGATGERII